jgi:pyrroloquinoline quinone (PQQ) biosynthesis protein C
MNTISKNNKVLQNIDLKVSFMNRELRGYDFVKKMNSYALTSSAVNHPYLDALKKGELSNMSMAIQDFAFQYGSYSSKFIHYVSTVINKLNDPKHVDILTENLNEEKGHSHDVELPKNVSQSIQGVPHSLLYKRFQEALGVNQEYKDNHRYSQFSQLWSKNFLQLCDMDECVAIGAIGIGTELITPQVYEQILTGLKSYTELTLNERIFFDLHSVCDVKHAEQLVLIASDLAVDSDACEKIEYGARSALYLRTLFWDKMLVRAIISQQPNHSIKLLPRTEH